MSRIGSYFARNNNPQPTNIQIDPRTNLYKTNNEVNANQDEINQPNVDNHNQNAVNQPQGPNPFSQQNMNANRDQACMDSYKAKMLSDKQHGFINGRQLNVRGNFTRITTNKYGEQVVKEFDPKTGAQINYLHFSHVDVDPNTNDEQFQQIFSQIDHDFNAHAVQNNVQSYLQARDYRRRIYPLIRGCYSVLNEYNETAGVDVAVYGPKDLVALATFFCQYIDFTQYYKIGLFKKSDLRFNQETGKWNFYWYQRYKAENLDFLEVMKDRNGVLKAKSTYTGFKCIQINDV